MRLEDISEGLHVRYVAYEGEEQVEGQGVVTWVREFRSDGTKYPYPIEVLDDATCAAVLLLASEVKEVSP